MTSATNLNNTSAFKLDSETAKADFNFWSDFGNGIKMVGAEIANGLSKIFSVIGINSIADSLRQFGQGLHEDAMAYNNTKQYAKALQRQEQTGEPVDYNNFRMVSKAIDKISEYKRTYFPEEDNERLQQAELIRNNDPMGKLQRMIQENNASRLEEIDFKTPSNKSKLDMS